eukprot:TRINITY_DN3304_c0_g1_i1.p2 TRINITY_DN3304_c0_g1~~TRINITY_DN3304_c0_g1_i1.p2  ORF type:complete len:71 (-),score=5.69 TRINITY_DN3304_c0_g1_i1:29-241(-)
MMRTSSQSCCVPSFLFVSFESCMRSKQVLQLFFCCLGAIFTDGKSFSHCHGTTVLTTPHVCTFVEANIHD